MKYNTNKDTWLGVHEYMILQIARENLSEITQVHLEHRKDFGNMKSRII